MTVGFLQESWAKKTEHSFAEVACHCVTSNGYIDVYSENRQSVVCDFALRNNTANGRGPSLYQCLNSVVKRVAQHGSLSFFCGSCRLSKLRRAG